MKDLINRQAVIDAFWKLDVELRPSAMDAVVDMLKSLPTAEPNRASCKQVTGKLDLIDRQDAIDAIMSEPPDAHYPSWYADILKELPSASTDLSTFSDKLWKIAYERGKAEGRKKGKWIYGEKSGQDGWYCSECGGFIPWDYDFYGLDNIDFIEDFKTCPFCDSKMVSYTGADMRGDSDDL